MTAGKYFSKMIFQCKCVLLFLILFIFNSITKNAWRNGRSGTAVFRENLVAMDAWQASVDMDMDGKFHIHGKPAVCPSHSAIASKPTPSAPWRTLVLRSAKLFRKFDKDHPG